MLLLATFASISHRKCSNSQDIFPGRSTGGKISIFHLSTEASPRLLVLPFYGYLVYPVKTVLFSRVLRAQSSRLKEPLLCLPSRGRLRRACAPESFQTQAPSQRKRGRCWSKPHVARGSQRSLEHVAKDTEDAVEVLEFSSLVAVVRSSLPLDTSHHLSNHHKINDQGRGKERILADVEQTVVSG
jgi:hypothetical protein